jgi:hypothetical protein
VRDSGPNSPGGCSLSCKCRDSSCILHAVRVCARLSDPNSPRAFSLDGDYLVSHELESPGTLLAQLSPTHSRFSCRRSSTWYHCSLRLSAFEPYITCCPNANLTSEYPQLPNTKQPTMRFISIGFLSSLSLAISLVGGLPTAEPIKLEKRSASLWAVSSGGAGGSITAPTNACVYLTGSIVSVQVNSGGPCTFFACVTFYLQFFLNKP